MNTQTNDHWEVKIESTRDEYLRPLYTVVKNGRVIKSGLLYLDALSYVEIKSGNTYTGL